MAGRGYCQLKTERGKFRIDDGTLEMVRRGVVCAPEQRAHHCSSV